MTKESQEKIKPYFRQIVLTFSVALLMSGCTTMSGTDLQDQQNENVQKQLEKRQYLQQLEAKPEKKLERDPKENEAIGDRYLQSGDVNNAFLYYSKALLNDPDNTGLLYKAGKLLLMRKLYIDAEHSFLKILSIDAENGPAHEGLGQSYFGRGKFDRAEVEFKKAAALDPGLWQSFNYLGLIYSKQKDFDRAIVEYQKAFALSPGNTEIINNLAISHYIKEEYATSVRLLESAVRNRTTDKQVYNNLAVAYCKLDRYYDALEAFRRGTDNEAVAYNNIGWEYLTNNRYDEAVDAFEKALSLNPRFYERASANLEKARRAKEAARSQ